ncbi:MAG: DUF3169 family protein [Agathobacter sp.]|nr:DUF3169 family protein [Agathobacter sp.]
MKKENAVTKRKTLIKFIILMILSMVVGYVSAFAFDMIISAGAEHMELIEKAIQIVAIAVPITYVILDVLVLGLSYANYFKAKKMVAKWDGEDEDIIEKIESKLGIAITMNNILLVFHFFFFSATVEIAFGEEFHLPLAVFAIAMLLIGLIAMIVLTVLVVNLEKQLNPEKRGDALDTKFNKEWLASCDEAQQKMIHEAGYKAFKAGQHACMCIWIVTLLGQLFFDTGIFPVICVFIIYATLVISYSVASIKLEIKKSE